MENFFTISRTAEIVNMTTETLRHYDRIDLVKPCKTDKFTGYRYYSEREIVRLNTIRSLRCMDLTLSEIKEVLEFDDFEKIIRVLKQAEKNADDKIAELKHAQSKIQAARSYYESKTVEKTEKEIFIKQMPRRVVLLSEKMHTPTLDNLWDYHRHFYDQVGEKLKDKFSFEDVAGIFESQGQTRLFAVCNEYSAIESLEFLPKGKYLCCDCTENDKEEVLEKLLEEAKNRFSVVPKFTVQIIVISGILQWKYQIQIFIG